ncbi:MAG: nucleoside-diphosphate-sugar epimerase [Acidobacteriaceae bacterium]|nr:nucleoside-diphosphate-sugar epimerase [Acidobacteriaceae bacterium]
MNEDSRIFVAGHRGLVGSAITAYLEQQGFRNVLKRTRAELDLLDTRAVEGFFAAERPEYVFLAAAKVGGILANDTYPADFIRDNLILQTNVIEASRRAGVQRLLFLGSSCIYPRLAPQPIREESLLTGPLEATNRPYSLAKIAGIEMCWAYNRQYATQYLAAMPTNLYGPHDNFDLTTSHVLPALMRKVVEAKAAGRNYIEVWGTGTPRRELLYSEDLAEACVFLMQLPDAQFATLINTEHAPLINIGTGEDLTIRELAELVGRELGFKGELRFDTTKPDGTPRKLLDVSRIRALGWRAKTDLDEGIRRTYAAVEAQLRA